jgi:hypothetical protein
VIGQTSLADRRVAQIENESVRVSVTLEGGHIAEILEKETGINPLWIPPWPSIEPSAWNREDSTYGNNAESKLICGILGHSLCLDMFGPPSEEEFAAGVFAHGEAGVIPWEFTEEADALLCRCVLPGAQLAFERRIALDGHTVRIGETVENLAPLDRPIAWTQHVTLGPPFLKRGATLFQANAGGLRETHAYTSAETSGGYTANLVDPQSPDGWFWAWSPDSGVLMGYVWKREDFPWLGVWEENCSRAHSPWNGRTITRGMEFGVSPFPETRRQMIERGATGGVPGYRWIGARQKISARYYAQAARAEKPPEKPEDFTLSIRS